MEASDAVSEYTISIIANGQPRKVKAGSSIAEFLQELNISSSRVVAQLNGVIVPRTELGSAILRAGDQLELVTMVGGG